MDACLSMNKNLKLSQSYCQSANITDELLDQMLNDTTNDEIEKSLVLQTGILFENFKIVKMKI